MRILAVGGGSGGHVTPVVAVLRELKRRDNTIQLRFWCDKAFIQQARNIIGNFDASVPVEVIVAGKLRRYHSLPVWRQLLRPVSIVIPNIIDAFLVICGLLQSIVKLLIWRPDVVFTKGGYVCLPVGVAARLLRIPLVIHDSDAHPGLTNRILAKWATAIATGAPLENYPYPKAISRYVGIPIATEFKPYSNAQRQHIKATLGFDKVFPLVVVTGGGLGAQRINDAVVARLTELTQFTSVLLISGAAQYDALREAVPKDTLRFQLHSFVSEGMVDMLGAADIVVARAGATTLLELAALAKPTILIPNKYLTGGHQLKNAAAYARSGAVLICDEDTLVADPSVLTKDIHDLIADTSLQRKMADAFFAYARPHAASDVANLVLGAAKKGVNLLQ